jgi:lipid II:glycine glycyltransferase (peptidoglycan interpeptide bridge formation enzyme)
MEIEIRAISKEEHQGFISGLPNASFLQLPEWGAVKSDWKNKSIGIYYDASLIGVGLLLTRALPKVGKSFGYIPEGPLFRPQHNVSKEILEALVSFAKREKIFLLRVGPAIPYRDWEGEVIKSALASDQASSLLSTKSSAEFENGRSTIESFERASWRAVVSESGFSEGQPNFVFQ